MHKLGPITLLGLLVALPVTSAAVDLNGRWLVDGGVPMIVTITQTGSALSIPYQVPFTGTVGATDPNGFTSYSVSWTDGTNYASFGGRVMPSGNVFDGQGGAYFPPNPPSAGPINGTRCSCFDNNSVNGDGCDASCQVEPCWTCVGDPSVCSPTPDGGACDDGNPCTTGETCSLGVCGSGTPVASCFFMGGPWTNHLLIPSLASETHEMITVIQRGTDLRVGSYIGAIDPVTGAFDIRSGNTNLFCGFNPLTGSLAADGLTYSATGYVEVPEVCCPDQCIQFPATDLGDHCGDGNLDPSEQCDDGNLTAGDGCSPLCAVEQCYACTGSPSMCTPTPGAPCVDQNVCTVNETCGVDGSCTGSPLDCGQCETCIYPNGCVAAPQPVCKASTAPEKSMLAFKHNGNEKMDRLNWRWKKGADTTANELGDPSVDQDLTLCVYDESYVTPALLFSAAIPASNLWTATATGFRYKDPSKSNDGVLLATLDAGVGGKAGAKVKGKGIHLTDRPNSTPAPPLPLPVRVQLRGSNGLCLETRHDATSVIKNDPASGIFKARGVP